jgi:hypothetical protein
LIVENILKTIKLIWLTDECRGKVIDHRI